MSLIGTKRPFRRVAPRGRFRGNNRRRAATLNRSLLTHNGHRHPTSVMHNTVVVQRNATVDELKYFVAEVRDRM